MLNMFLCANLVEKVRIDLGEGGLTRASTGPYLDQCGFLFTRGSPVERTEEPARKLPARLRHRYREVWIQDRNRTCKNKAQMRQPERLLLGEHTQYGRGIEDER